MTRLLLTACIPVVFLSAGCAIPATVFRITNHRAPGVTERFREAFDQAWYHFDAAGNVDIVALHESEDSAAGAAPLTQVIHIHGLWRAIPGRTVAHRTQINATVTYRIESGTSEAIFRGAGSLFLDRRARDGRLVGKLELATLHPAHRGEPAAGLLQHAVISGQFTALPDSRRTVAHINMLDRRLADAR